MRKHKLLLSLLVLLFAIFTTACENSSSKGASISGPDQGIIVKPTITVEATRVDAMTFDFKGTLSNASVSDYTFEWDFGDGTTLADNGSLQASHTFTTDGGYSVTLRATPIDENNTIIVEGSAPATASTSGIIYEGLRAENTISGLDYQFTLQVSTIETGELSFSWNFGDGSEAVETTENVATHKYAKYNTEYPLSVVITNKTNGQSLTITGNKIKTSDLHGEIIVINNPENATQKTFSVNIYDENNQLVHGSSINGGDVVGLENVIYNWNFGDNQYDNNTANRVVQHTYAGNASNTYTVTVNTTTDNYDGQIPATAEANVELVYSVPELLVSLTGEYGLTLEASAQGFGGAAYANKEVTYSFTLPNGETATQTVTHDAEGNLAEPVVVTTELTKYLDNYQVTLEVIDNGVVVSTSSAAAVKPTFNYEITVGDVSGSYYGKTFTAAPKSGSFSLKDATYTWNFGDGTGNQQGNASVEHTYTKVGNFTITVTVTSALLEGSNISVQAESQSIVLTDSITINSLSCVNTSSSANKFLQNTCTVSAKTANGITPTYKWYVDNVVQNNQTGASFTKIYDKYNKTYTVKVEVGVQGISGVTPVTKTAPASTPAVWALMTGPNNLNPGQEGIYTVVPKVSYGGSTVDVTLTGANYTFKIKETSATQNQGASNQWVKSFVPWESDYNGGNSVTRTITASITASNINGGAITSSETVTTVTKPEASLASFQSAVISCSPANNGANLAKQQCKVTLAVKSNAGTLYGNFNQYKAKLTSNGVTKSVTFDDKAITAGASQVSTTVDFDFNLPNYGDIATGSPQSASYTVTGYIYKGVDESKKLNATAGTVNINLNMDYVLFPYPASYVGKGGGSGYTFATWSCGFNEKYGKGYLTGAGCGSGGSSTLNLGSLANADGTLKGRTKFEWHVRINKANGQNIPDTKVAEFTVNAGAKPTDANLKFNIANPLINKGFIGSAYNNTTNTIYLQITPADDVNAKPIRVWYNGTNKTNHGNRLQKITPIAHDDATCQIEYKYHNIFWQGFDEIEIYLKELNIEYSGSYANSSDTVFVIPTDSTYKPTLRFNANVVGISDAWNKNYTIDFNGYGVEGSIYTTGGWNMYWPSNDALLLNNDPNGLGSTNIDEYKSTAGFNIIFKDMLSGSSNQWITDYYKPVSCSISIRKL